MQRQKKEQMELVAKEKEALKKKEKDLKSAENKEKEEIKTAENLIKEGSERLNQAISKKDFKDVRSCVLRTFLDRSSISQILHHIEISSGKFRFYNAN